MKLSINEEEFEYYKPFKIQLDLQIINPMIIGYANGKIFISKRKNKKISFNNN